MISTSSVKQSIAYKMLIKVFDKMWQSDRIGSRLGVHKTFEFLPLKTFWMRCVEVLYLLELLQFDSVHMQQYSRDNGAKNVY